MPTPTAAAGIAQKWSTRMDRDPRSDTGTLSRPLRGTGLRSLLHQRPDDEPELPSEGRLPAFAGATAWLNSPPLTPAGLRGQVVLVDFWTYTCVNWLRTLPYVRAWATKYAGAGLVVVGVHTPEFRFEQNLENVTSQARVRGVHYPVAVDNDYTVWQAFANHYWPAVYLADAEGHIRYHHFGEGEYAMTEMVIQQLLMRAGATVDGDLVQVEPQGLEVPADWRSLRSPETYLGYAQSTGFASARHARLDLPHRYEADRLLELNTWDLSGMWTAEPDAALLDEPGGSVVFQYQARDANLIMGPTTGGAPVRFQVLVDGAAPREASGTDVDADGAGTAAEQRCYQLVRHRIPVEQHRFEIRFLDPGIRVYCFTFG
jgi:thiol-disulfide isomerase/thioredoxin